MEDDILNNVDMGDVGTNIANTETVFAFSLSGNSSMTKAGEITENPNDVTSTESSISNCFVAIIKDGLIVYKGKKRDILTDEILSDVFDIDVSVVWKKNRPWIIVK